MFQARKEVSQAPTTIGDCCYQDETINLLVHGSSRASWLVGTFKIYWHPTSNFAVIRLNLEAVCLHVSEFYLEIYDEISAPVIVQALTELNVSRSNQSYRSSRREISFTFVTKDYNVTMSINFQNLQHLPASESNREGTLLRILERLSRFLSIGNRTVLMTRMKFCYCSCILINLIVSCTLNYKLPTSRVHYC